MIDSLNLFAAKPAPFSWPRFLGFMACLAGVTFGTLAGERRAATQDTALTVPAAGAGSSAAGTVDATVVRFAMPMEDAFDDLHQVGLPWFLRRLGAAASVEERDAATIAVEVSLGGKAVGTFFEHLVALDADRSKLFVSFVPSDAGLVERLAGSLGTKLAPAALMRVVMAEYLRSSVTGSSFDMHVLTDTPGSRLSVFGRAFRDSGKCEDPQTDDFQPCSSAEASHNIRKIYREEADQRAIGGR